jgi:hypothetical protein
MMLLRARVEDHREINGPGEAADGRDVVKLAITGEGQ